MPNIPDIFSFYSTPSATSGTSPIIYTDPETVPALVFELKELVCVPWIFRLKYHGGGASHNDTLEFEV